jgi:hypothetical protein
MVYGIAGYRSGKGKGFYFVLTNFKGAKAMNTVPRNQTP